jgi:hypothetical protein
MSGILQSEHGIVSVEEKKEWTSLRRGGGAGDGRRPSGSSESIIGGIDVPNHYQTTIQRQNEGEGTSVDQLSLIKRVGTKKLIADPGTSSTSDLHQREQYERMVAMNTQANQNVSGQSNLRPSASYMSKSLISNIGASIKDKVAPPPSTPTHNNDIQLPPEYRKQLLVENYRNFPGMFICVYLCLYFVNSNCNTN